LIVKGGRESYIIRKIGLNWKSSIFQKSGRLWGQDQFLNTVKEKIGFFKKL